MHCAPLPPTLWKLYWQVAKSSLEFSKLWWEDLAFQILMLKFHAWKKDWQQTDKKKINTLLLVSPLGLLNSNLAFFAILVNWEEIQVWKLRKDLKQTCPWQIFQYRKFKMWLLMLAKDALLTSRTIYYPYSFSSTYWIRCVLVARMFDNVRNSCEHQSATAPGQRSFYF